MRTCAQRWPSVAPAFRAEVELPRYEYLTHLRVSRAKALLQREMLVAQAAQGVGFGRRCIGRIPLTTEELTALASDGAPQGAV